MMMDLHPYPAYKDSGVPWLGEVPEHWEVRRGKALFQCIDVRSSTGEEELLTVSSKQGVVPRRSATVTMFKAESYVGYKLCWPGDLVINSLWAWGGGLGVSRYHGIVSSAYGVYRLRPEFEEYSSFIHELVRSRSFHWELQVRSKGIWISRLQLTDEAFLDAPFPLPPPDEQIVIVRFLDFADRRIRRSIHAKQKLIRLLEEQKQAIIHQAVTRGLDPNVRLKPSGVEWLGKVPEHWKFAKLARLTARIGDGLHGTPEYVDESGYHFINGNNLSGGHIKITPSTRCVSEAEFQKYRLPLSENTILMSINGTIGNVAFYRGESLVLGKSAAYINCDKSLVREFLFFFLQSSAVKEFFRFELTGTTIFNLSLASVRNLPVALPPLNEQIEISSFVEAKTADFEAMVGCALHEISLLREYRTRLIADVVTGKMDVRRLALPAEIDIEEILAEDVELLDNEMEGIDKCECAGDMEE